MSRFADKTNFEPKINISTTYSNLISQTNFEPITVITPQNVTGQPLLKNITTPPTSYNSQVTAPVIAAPPVLLNIPPPQVIQTQLPLQLVPTVEALSNEMAQRTVLATVTVPPPTATEVNIIGVPPPCIPTIELSSIPPPNPIQVHNIPQPEPINTLTIPPPAPMQVQNIPPPSPIHLNEIPNPKPLDLLNIPTPSDGLENNDFIKNIPPPNKSVPPPSLPESALTVNVNVTVPPPQNASANNMHACLPPPNLIPPTTMPPPQTMPTPDTLLVHTVPPPTQQNLVIQTAPTVSVLQSIPPPIQAFTARGAANSIPSLMAQPIMPPPGMGIAPPPINVSCPPPNIQGPTALQGTVGFVGLTNQMPPMNVPPPTAILPAFKDLSTGKYGFHAGADVCYCAGRGYRESVGSQHLLVYLCVVISE